MWALFISNIIYGLHARRRTVASGKTIAEQLGFDLEQLELKTPALFSACEDHDEANFCEVDSQSGDDCSHSSDDSGETAHSDNIDSCCICAEGEGGELRYIDFDSFV